MSKSKTTPKSTTIAPSSELTATIQSKPSKKATTDKVVAKKVTKKSTKSKASSTKSASKKVGIKPSDVTIIPNTEKAPKQVTEGAVESAKSEKSVKTKSTKSKTKDVSKEVKSAKEKPAKVKQEDWDARKATLNELQEMNWISQEQQDAITKALSKEANIVILGPTGAGKSTMFAAVMNEYYKMNDGQVLPTLLESPREESKFLLEKCLINIPQTIAPIKVANVNEYGLFTRVYGVKKECYIVDEHTMNNESIDKAFIKDADKHMFITAHANTKDPKQAVRDITTKLQLNESKFQTLFIVLGFKEDELPTDKTPIKVKPDMLTAEIYTIRRGKAFSVKKVC